MRLSYVASCVFAGVVSEDDGPVADHARDRFLDWVEGAGVDVGDWIALVLPCGTLHRERFVVDHVDDLEELAADLAVFADTYGGGPGTELVVIRVGAA
jgi:hypothetical protein